MKRARDYPWRVLDPVGHWLARADGWVRPACFERMCKTAKALAKPFEFVRVDLYEVDNEIFFGELTFSPGAGMELPLPLRLDPPGGATAGTATSPRDPHHL